MHFLTWNVNLKEWTKYGTRLWLQLTNRVKNFAGRNLSNQKPPTSLLTAAIFDRLFFIRKANRIFFSKSISSRHLKFSKMHWLTPCIKMQIVFLVFIWLSDIEASIYVISSNIKNSSFCIIEVKTRHLWIQSFLSIPKPQWALISRWKWSSCLSTLPLKIYSTKTRSTIDCNSVY